MENPPFSYDVANTVDETLRQKLWQRTNSISFSMELKWTARKQFKFRTEVRRLEHWTLYIAVLDVDLEKTEIKHGESWI